PRRHRHEPGLRGTEGVARGCGAGHLRWAGERRGGDLPRPRVPRPGGGLAFGRGQGARAPVRGVRAAGRSEPRVTSPSKRPTTAPRRLNLWTLGSAPVGMKTATIGSAIVLAHVGVELPDARLVGGGSGLGRPRPRVRSPARPERLSFFTLLARREPGAQRGSASPNDLGGQVCTARMPD